MAMGIAMSGPAALRDGPTRWQGLRKGKAKACPQLPAPRLVSVVVLGGRRALGGGRGLVVVGGEEWGGSREDTAGVIAWCLCWRWPLAPRNLGGCLCNA